MFERFTEEAGQIIVLAHDEAMKLSHDHIGTEHMLLALLRGDPERSGRVLAALGVTPDWVRSEVVRLVGEGDRHGSGAMPFTPRADAALKLALAAAPRGEAQVEPKHLLLGIAGEGEGVGARILREADVDEELIRTELGKAQ
jgi:ATP-dependent Clp protease ATP-binding subunit ClpC